MKTATADDWEIMPLPEHYITIELDILLTERQSERVKKGFIPDEMEEKWFCYYKENTLYQHRSWTGICIDEIDFVSEGKQLRAVSARVNREPSQYSNTDDAEDLERITKMLDWLYQPR